MTYQEARSWLDQTAGKGNRLGLERMRSLMHELGDPQDGLKFIHIAGTNGKGSVMTFLERTLVLAGYRVGRYLSPVLFCYEEKIRFQENSISKEDLAALTQILREACDRMAARGEELPTIFEVETAMAFLFFRSRDCDLVLLETGMGGAEDATNVVRQTVLEIFSSISLDHMEYLGDTVEAIAAVKAGILKEGSLAVSAVQSPEAHWALRRAAEQKGVPIAFVDPERLSDVCYGLTEQSFRYGGEHEIRIGMPGTWQVGNACTALEAVDALRSLGYRLEEDIIRRGFAQARIEGRFQVMQTRPLVIMDGAHNPEAALRLRESLLTYLPWLRERVGAARAGEAGTNVRGQEQNQEQNQEQEQGLRQGRVIFVMGVLADKDYREEIALTAPLADRIYTVETRDNPRALPAGKLAEAVREVNPCAQAVGDVEKALELALREAGDRDAVILFGSLSWLAQAKAFFAGEEKRNE